IFVPGLVPRGPGKPVVRGRSLRPTVAERIARRQRSRFAGEGVRAIGVPVEPGLEDDYVELRSREHEELLESGLVRPRLGEVRGRHEDRGTSLELRGDVDETDERRLDDLAGPEAFLRDFTRSEHGELE